MKKYILVLRNIEKEKKKKEKHLQRHSGSGSEH